jgi:hypothetical protein
VTTSQEVDAWFRDLDHPFKDEMLQVRKIILETDSRIGETIKVEESNLRVRRQHGQHRSTNEEARQPDVPSRCVPPRKHPQLEGGGGTVRYMRFANTDEVMKKRRDLEAAVLAWCSLRG